MGRMQRKEREAFVFDNGGWFRVRRKLQKDEGK